MKRFLTLAKLIPIMVLMMFVGVEAQEIAQYQFKKSVEAWTPIAGTVQNPPRLNSDEGNTNIIPIGFDFPFDGRIIRTVVVTTNGFVRLGDDASKSIFGTSLGNNNISDNLNPLMLDAKTGSIETKLSGTAGNRVFSIQWNNYSFWNSDKKGSMQVKLYENGNIQFVYGPGIAGLTKSATSQDPWRIFLCGNSKENDFIGVNATNPNVAIIRNVNEYDNKDQYANIANLTEGTTFTFIAKPLLVNILPNDDKIYLIGKTYITEQFGPKVNFENLEAGVEVKLSYRIVTDNETENLIYRALNPASSALNDTTITINGPVSAFPITRATGPAAGADGTLDLTNPTNNPYVRPGNYKAIAIYSIPSLGIRRTVVSKFRIAHNKDLEVATVLSPVSFDEFKYEKDRRIEVKAQFRNVGVQEIKAFRATAKIFFEQETTPVYQDTDTLEILEGAGKFTTNTYKTIAFEQFLPERGTGNYRVEVTAETLIPRGNNVYDLDGDYYTPNNIFPKLGTKPYYFSVSENVDLMVAQILRPSKESYSIGLPMIPTVRIKNVGANNIGPSAVVNVKVLNSEDIVIYEATEKVHSIPVRPKGIYVDVPMNKNLIIDNPGTYKVVAEVISSEDEKLDNNTMTLTFTIVPGISGTYTIGSKEKALDEKRNFENFDKALSTIHLRTVAGPITLLLTETEYNIDRIGANVPALDFSSKIIGVNETNTITIKAAPAIDTVENVKININMNTESGIGVLFGQSSVSSVDIAPVNEVFAELKNKYAKSEGYITIDGGEHKSLVFNLKSNSNFRSAFYLAQGASNITIKNVIANDNAANPAIEANIPTASYSNDKYTYSLDKNYSAGILLRSVAPFDRFLFNKSGEIYNKVITLDTLVNTNNLIAGNEVEGFNIGIASMGVGVLLKEIKTLTIDEDSNQIIKSTFELAEYLNHDNKIQDNKISKGKVAGILLGFENNSDVTGNFISDFESDANPTYGILLGNQIPTNNSIGYYNINNKIRANRVFRIKSTEEANGIALIQNKNVYTISADPTQYVFPIGMSRNIIESNAVTSINAKDDDANRFGINVKTSRKLAQSTPAYVGFRTKGDVIANNTILLSEDGMNNTGIIAGINLMQVNEAKVINNLLLLDDNITNTSENSLIRLTSKMPEEENLFIDRNVYFYDKENDDNDLIRFHQTNIDDVVYNETGIHHEYSNLEQWQNWTNMDQNSFFYDFRNEVRVETDGTTEIIKVGGRYTLNSKMNNTGYLFKEIKFSDDVLLSDLLRGKDIMGEIRGQADARYDIGANEFFGEVYVRDFEVLKILSPNNYQATTGDFRDVNYVMTKAPVNVTALIRNNGSMPAKRVLVKAVITRQFNSGKWDSTYTEQIPIGDGKFKDSVIKVSYGETFYTYVDIDQYGHAVANFDIGNPDKTPVFVPHTYYELKNYVTPVKYAEMRTNVSPLYRINVEIVDGLDQKPANSKLEKTYRFFIKKSNNDLLVTAENVGADLNGIDYTANADYNTDVVAGKLNYDSLKVAFNKMGFYQVKGIENPYYHFDVIDRTLWEPRAFDYNVYNTLFWIDGNDKQLTKVQEGDLREYLDNKNQEANWNYKKSIIVSSQEFLRENGEKADFLRDYISAVNAGEGNPLGKNVDYSGNLLKGDAIAKDYMFTVLSTGFTVKDAANAVIFSDANSRPAAMTLNTNGLGITAPATIYKRAGDNPEEIQNNIAGSTTYGLTRNMIYLGQDWRHFGNGDMLLRGLFDYLDKHGSTLTPVELVDFEAIDRNRKVELSWATASELNSSHFEIEKAMVAENGNTTFQVIATEPAAGKSNVTKSYGPIVDKDVNYGATYVYRLRSVDQDGTSSLSNEVEVSIDNFFGVSPNPASSNVTYSYSIGEAQNAQIEIYDVTGKMVKSLFNGVSKANDSIQFNVAELANGTYTIVLKTATNTYTTKLSVRK